MTRLSSIDPTNLARTGKVGQPVKVWDPLVRVLHWTMALGVIANLTLLRENEDLHNIVGYVVLGALSLRIIWGFVGTRHARFADFVPRPTTLAAYLRAMLARREPRYIGHNPAGSVMIIALLMLLAALGITGWMMSLDRFWGVPWVESLHETAANIVMVAAILHVLAAIFESVRHRENLPWSIISGYKRAPSGTDVDHAPPAH
ncbi:MAG: cytochrome B [Alphaproteobacteria bacterium]|nr:MAG: cytochrome B [Alphaproteobacteria bacterium]